MKSHKFRLLSPLCALVAGAPMGFAADVTKSAAGTDLADGANWGGSAPTAADTAVWDSGSLGAGLTLDSAAAWQGIRVEDALTNVDITGSGALTLGSGGIDVSGVDFSIGNAIGLDADQTWAAASGRTLTASGIISGTSGLTFGALAPTQTTDTFLNNTFQTLFTGVSLADLTTTRGMMGGAWVNSGTPLPAVGYFLNNDGTNADFWIQQDDGFTKGVRIELQQNGSDIDARATAAKNTGGGNVPFDFNNGGTGAPLAFSNTDGGYGAASTTLTFGEDATGTVILSAVNTYTGPTTVTRGTLRAGVASVDGVGGAFGLDSAVSLDNDPAAGIDLDGFDTRIGSLAGGGNLGGNLALGAGTLTLGGDDSSTSYGGAISGTGGLVKIGTGTQTLTRNNSYSGGTTISEGTMIGSAGVSFDGTQGGSFGTGEITVESGATLRTTAAFVAGGGWNTTRTVNVAGTLNIEGAGPGGEYLRVLNLTGGLVTTDSAGIFFRAPTGGIDLSTSSSSQSSNITTRIDLTFGNLSADVAAGTAPGGQDLVISGAITQNSGGGAGAKSLTKTGDGSLVLAGSSSYTGATTVSAGTLLVTGALGASAVTVESGATLGGDGTLGGPLAFAAGSQLDLTGATIDLTSTGILSVAAGESMTFTDFGFASLVGWDWLNAPEGTYTLIDGGGTVTLAGTTPTVSNPFDFGNGRSGYFQEGSFQAVIIPEPAVAVLGGLGLLGLLRRRRA